MKPPIIWARMWISRVTWPRALRWNKNRSGQTYLIPVFAGSYLPRLSVKTSLFGVGGVIWRFLLLTYVSMFRAKSAIFLARAEKSYF